MNSVFGWIPAPATTPVITYSNGSTSEVDAGTDGYFLHLSPRSEAGVTHIEARSATGELVAEHQLP